MKKYSDRFKYIITRDVAGYILTLICNECEDVGKYYLGYDWWDYKCSCGNKITNKYITRNYPTKTFY